MKAYAIKDPNEFIFISSISKIKELCKIQFCQEHEDQTFEDLEEIGYRCVPVSITEIKQEKK